MDKFTKTTVCFAGQDTERFSDHFCTYTKANYGANSDYDDINTAMRDVYHE